VVIRSAYRWDDETVVRDKGASETWYMGAGGAITDLSTEEGEWEEMLTKLRGTLRSFAPGAEAKVWG
jgi:para-aminobenzoate synthetase